MVATGWLLGSRRGVLLALGLGLILLPSAVRGGKPLVACVDYRNETCSKKLGLGADGTTPKLPWQGTGSDPLLKPPPQTAPPPQPPPATRAPSPGRRAKPKAESPSPQQEPPPCEGGRQRIAGECCWPGQDVGRTSGVCLGKPTRCPPGLEPKCEGCAPGPRPSCDSGMVGLPAGTFEGHAIGSFCLDATAVTTRDYTRWCKAQTGETRKACEPATGTYYNWEVPGREDHPINGVNWDQANAYCRARVSGTRLPTEWEREWAARGDARGWTYPWGTDDPSPLLPVCWDGGSDLAKGARQSTCPVRQHPRGATPEGLFGLAGNVWEWTDSWWDEKTKSARVVRGGSWNYMDAAILRAGARTNYAPGYRYFYLGFRCARTAGR